MTGTTEGLWKLLNVYCISCGDDLGVRMTKQDNQEYFYCHLCHGSHIQRGIDIEDVYNNKQPLPLGDKR